MLYNNIHSPEYLPAVLVLLVQFIQSLSGVQLHENATILSVTATVISGSSASILITLITTEGGSEELTMALFVRVNITAQEIGLIISQPPMRFGEFRRLYTHSHIL